MHFCRVFTLNQNMHQKKKKQRDLRVKGWTLLVATSVLAYTGKLHGCKEEKSKEVLKKWSWNARENNFLFLSTLPSPLGVLFWKSLVTFLTEEYEVDLRRLNANWQKRERRILAKEEGFPFLIEKSKLPSLEDFINASNWGDSIWFT